MILVGTLIGTCSILSNQQGLGLSVGLMREIVHTLSQRRSDPRSFIGAL